MRKTMLALILMGSILPMEACRYNSAHHQSKDHKLFHFKDGRVGYQDDDEVWWYIVMIDGQPTSAFNSSTIAGTASRGTSLGFTGSYSKATFARGDKPSEEEIEEATEEEAEGVEGEASEGSEGASEGAADSASESSSGDSGGDAGGGGD